MAYECYTIKNRKRGNSITKQSKVLIEYGVSVEDCSIPVPLDYLSDLNFPYLIPI
ncbi:MAG: hypothetical protein FWH29_00090 [Methanobrevibacter sp.]|nr:hypothetical protein [Methanobrevibacter sp.]